MGQVNTSESIKLAKIVNYYDRYKYNLSVMHVLITMWLKQQLPTIQTTIHNDTWVKQIVTE